MRDAEAGVEYAQRELDKAPPLDREALFYWTAFIELGTDRPQTMNGAGQIPLSAIRAYCDDLDMEFRDREDFKRIIMNVDNRRALLISNKAKREQASARSKPSL